MTGSIPSPLVYDGSPVQQWLKITTKGLILVLRRFKLLVRLYWQFLPGLIMYATFPVMFYYGDMIIRLETKNLLTQKFTGLQFAYNREIRVTKNTMMQKHQKDE